MAEQIVATRKSTRRCKKCSKFFVTKKNEGLNHLCPECRGVK